MGKNWTIKLLGESELKINIIWSRSESHGKLKCYNLDQIYMGIS